MWKRGENGLTPTLGLDMQLPLLSRCFTYINVAKSCFIWFFLIKTPSFGHLSVAAQADASGVLSETILPQWDKT